MFYKKKKKKCTSVQLKIITFWLRLIKTLCYKDLYIFIVKSLNHNYSCVDDLPELEFDPRSLDD